MMKALKMGFFGLALGALGAVAFPAHEAVAQSTGTPAQQFGCCSYCNPSYVRCISQIPTPNTAACLNQRAQCESTCKPGC
ncbi:hypothetical protein ACN28S_15670 [Cystobacter fuscus]